MALIYYTTFYVLLSQRLRIKRVIFSLIPYKSQPLRYQDIKLGNKLSPVIPSQTYIVLVEKSNEEHM